MDDPKFLIALVAALSALAVAVVSALMARKNQRDLEVFRGRLDEERKEKDARRDYQYEARKRLYQECEPLLFLLTELSENARGRIYGLVRTARNGDLAPTRDGWLSSDEYYYFQSTLYRLLAPMAVFKLLQRRLTSVDLTVDQRIKAQYELAKLLYRSFRGDHEFAEIEPRLAYNPNHEEWKERCVEEPEVYWRQGVFWGRLDDVLDALTPQDEEGGRQLMSYGGFETAYSENAEFRQKFRLVILPLLRFHPRTRPVFWRILVTQAHLYEALLLAHSAGAAPGFVKRTLDLVPELERKRFDWRRDAGEAADEKVLVEPFTVARAFLREHLGDASEGVVDYPLTPGNMGDIVMPLNDEKKADVLMKAYDTLRAEILDRMKTAFSHLGYVGALIAFVIPLSSQHSEWYHWLAGAFGLLLLLWISAINWLWLRNCASHLRFIECQMNELSPGLVTWESRSGRLGTAVLLPPKSYEKVFGKTPGVDVK